MQLLFSYPHLAAPTVETIREYATKRFSKLQRYLPKFDGEHAVRISVRKERNQFYVQVEITVPKALVVKVNDFDLRKAIDMAYQVIKNMALKYRERVHERTNPST
ncbi:MAG: HPF/RaiA family ribosome-associated protein [Candidatus Doudnabacteria bacterium]|nr:HPF/RaiA family ribosome-associated protein [Candidatus Doudnabacteria bacterium]